MWYQVRRVYTNRSTASLETFRVPDGTTVSNKSFENLVNEHGRQVLGTAARVLRDANLAHDVHQEVFLAVWRRWHRYNGSVNWPAYLYRATVRKALELARRRVGRQIPSAKCPVPSESDGALRTCPAPDAAMQADELQQQLAAALARLPRRQADVFILSRLEKRETGEIAKLLGCSEPTVRVHLHRAVMKLAVELHEYLEGEP
jgi:RNA polymerase sigma-70 factor (ECF subfamily)